MELLSTFSVVLLYIAAGAIISSSRLPVVVKQILCVGLILRVVGVGLRWWVIFSFYGRGDAERYYLKGLEYADAFRKFDFSPIRDLIDSGNIWGTEFLEILSGFVLLVLGRAIFAEFLVFALGSFVGLMCFGIAFKRSYPDITSHKYLAWIMLFPSLWFWPVSVGKEAVVMLGLGISVLGYVGKKQRIRWPLMLAGAVLVYAARPELAAVLLASMLIGQWFSLAGRWTLSKIVQTAVFSLAALLVLQSATAYMGIEAWSSEGVQNYIEKDPSRRATGKTNVTAVGISLLQTPLAAANVYLRPFPWEATNPLVIASSLEVLAFLMAVAWRRRKLMRVLRHWRTDRFLRLALIFAVLYPVGLGMMVVNLGIIARQRVLLFPFLFVLLEAHPSAAQERSKYSASHARLTQRRHYNLPAPLAP